METENVFAKLASIDVSKHIEKKAGMSYLSWPWAVDQLMRADPSANWQFHEPTLFNETVMVSCTVTAFGKPLTMHLPVMDHRNKAIKNPDAFEVNKNMMRCLVKAIACHGLGLYIYAGEDLPVDDGKGKEPPKLDDKLLADHQAAIDAAGSLEALKTAFTAAYRAAESLHDGHAMALFNDAKDARKIQLTTKEHA